MSVSKGRLLILNSLTYQHPCPLSARSLIFSYLVNASILSPISKPPLLFIFLFLFILSSLYPMPRLSCLNGWHSSIFFSEYANPYFFRFHLDALNHVSFYSFFPGLTLSIFLSRFSPHTSLTSAPLNERIRQFNPVCITRVGILKHQAFFFIIIFLL